MLTRRLRSGREPPGSRTPARRCPGNCPDQQLPPSCRRLRRTPSCSCCASLNTCDRRVPPAWWRTDGGRARWLATPVPLGKTPSIHLWTYVTLRTRVLSVLRKLVSPLTNHMTRTEVTVASSGHDLFSSSCVDVRLRPSWLPFISFASCLSIVC